ncbi:xanthine dehydrogenase family protein molybdopterin-binding subunit [Saccharopolyspora gloriosae]|uniref:xanthine dehydrogenase family protein molybdopterin-binding subunit n=1 Tax=Saccharopolyspora gloriosae TaxID=455344 RepID=UPI001FB75666|nr:molybdopterin cofactor-binding domain-containing protein [Saccharopolyspora gloriosae]
MVFDPTKKSPTTPAIGRRRFLSYLLAAPTLTVATELALAGAADSAEAAVPSPPQLIGETVDLQDVINVIGAPTAALLFQITVHEDGTVTVPLPRAEVGQGLTTSVPMLIAEEMDIPLANVKMPLADARPELLFGQLTGGSSSMTSLYGPARLAAAAARTRLVATAALRWGLSRDRLTVSDGVVHAPDGRSASFGSLAVAAVSAKLPDLPVVLKPESEFKLIGSRVRRLDGHRIVTGTNTYTQDLDVAGAKPCLVRRPPTINGTVEAVHNADAVKRMTGVIDVAVIPTGVAVLAETFAMALDGMNAIDATWGPGTVDDESDETVRRKLRAAVGPLGDPPVTLPPEAGTLEMEFDFAFLSHAPLETNAAVADVRDGRAEVWTAVQVPTSAQENIARELGLPQTSVTVHVMPSGGSFGRRLFNDAAVEAAQISQAMGKPVKLIWHRTDDIRHGRVHPAKHHKVRVHYGQDQVLSYEHWNAAVDTSLEHGFGEALTTAVTKIPAVGNESVSQIMFRSMVHCPYNFGAVATHLHEVSVPMNTGSWRSVYSLNVRGVEEIVVDELARRLHKDPVVFRRDFLKDDRQRAVLDKVAAEGDWGRPMPDGFAQGVAFHDEMKGVLACLVEIDARDPGKPRVVKAVMVVDVGRPINVSGIEAQALGGLTDGISVALRGGLHLRDGCFLEGSYHNFHFARQKNSPTDVRIFVQPGEGQPGGMGEFAVPVSFAAVVNAYRRATGIMPASFPIDSEVDFEPYPPGPVPRPPMRPLPART